MRFRNFLCLLFGLFCVNFQVQASMCVREADWNIICDLPEIGGTRCEGVEFFRYYCAPGTAGCDKIPGGCVGLTPSGHWFPVVVNSVPSWRCRCGCFAEETVFSRESGEKRSGTDIIGTIGQELSTPFTVSTLDDFDADSYSDRPIHSVRFGAEKDVVIVFKTKSGRSITVSKSHPMVIAAGDGKLQVMKAAEEVELGEFFLRRDGEPEQITDISQKSYSGQMVNFNVVSDNPANHIVEADGFLTGDQGWQDQLNSYKSRMLWRNDILKFMSEKHGDANAN